MGKLRKGSGFTLIELITVIGIIALLLAVSVPAVVSYIEAGKQSAREMTARTLYLAAQNRLTGLKLAGGLEEFSADFYGEDGELKQGYGVVYTAGVVTPGEGESEENRPYVRYISKRKGSPAAEDPVVALLDPLVLDKSVFQNAILIEYNIKTGVVLSVFYSDTVHELLYSGTGGNEDISGDRPYYEHAARHQGYYGVGSTGLLEVGTEPLAIELYDGAGEENGKKTPLTEGGAEYENALYAAVYVHENRIKKDGALCLQLWAEDGKTLLFQSDPVDFAAVPQSAADAISGAGPHIVYKDSAYASDDGYGRYIWILDWVGGDMTVTPGASFGVKYGAATAAGDSVRAGVCSADGNARALSGSAKNPYFSGIYRDDGGEFFGVTSARHIYNVRYAPEGHFVQLSDVDMDGIVMAPLGTHYDARQKVGDGIDYAGFTPTAATSYESEFTGVYTASGRHVLDYMTVKSSGGAGLFTTIGSTGQVTDLIIRYANTEGAGVSGTVCSVNKGLVSAITTLDCAVSGGGANGGLAGKNMANARISDLLFIGCAAAPQVGGTGSAGIAAENYGSIARAWFLGVAPAAADGSACYPIVYNAAAGSAAEEVFYLSGVGLRPVMEKYNQAPASVGTPLGTDKMYVAELAKGYKRLTVTDPMQIVYTGQSFFPYAFLGAEGDAAEGFVAPVPEGCEWPVVKHVEAAAETGLLAYYEMYHSQGAGVVYGLWYYEDSVLKNTIKSDRAIKDGGFTLMEAGYGVLAPSDSGELSIQLAGARFDDVGPTALDAASGAPSGMALFAVDQEKLAARADAQLGSLTPGPVYLGNTELAGVWCVPNFARGVYLTREEPSDIYIRTMRQLRNITPVCERTASYWQETDIFAGNEAFYVGGSALAASAVDGEFKGSYSGYYSGEFNGDANEYHTITGFTMGLGGGQSAGLFAQVSGTVRYVLLLRADAGGNSDGSVGLIAGELLAKGELYGCTADINSKVSLSYADEIGGLVGLTEFRADVENCANAGPVTGTGWSTGGVAGKAGGPISYCYNTGTVNGKSTPATGGVAGEAAGAINNCYNTGTISGGRYTGGVAGHAYAGMTDCWNSGAVTSGTGNSSVGGVAGGAGDSSGSYTGIVFSNCFNTGSVSGNAYVAGVVGEAYGVTLANCFNEGYITASISGGVASVGGIAGMGSGVTVTHCFNSGSIVGSGAGYYAGGIAGSVKDGSEVAVCSNYGRVSAVNGSGGIAGQTEGSANSSCSVTQCSNYGSVAASGNTSGGLVGSAGYVNIDNCLNRGAITGGSRVGGLAGYTDLVSTISFCYNTYTVEYSTVFYKGNLVGYVSKPKNVRGCFVVKQNVLFPNFFGFGDYTTTDNKAFTSAGLSGELDSIVTGSGTALNTAEKWTKAPSGTVNGGYPVLLADGYTGGTGGDIGQLFASSGGAYIVSNAYQLDLMRSFNTSGVAFKMDRNIYLGYDFPNWTPIGDKKEPFMPSFNGDGFTVSTVTTTGSKQYSGFFGNKSGGAITGLGVTGTIAGGSASYIGGIAGYSSAKMEGCRNLAAVSSDHAKAESVGGVVGYLYGAEGTKLYNAGTVTVTAPKADGVGGVAGAAHSPIVSNDSGLKYCYNIGVVNATASVYAAGGTMGILYEQPLDSYNTGAVVVGGNTGYELCGTGALSDFGDKMLWHFSLGGGGSADIPQTPEATTLAYYEVYSVRAQDGTVSTRYGFFFYGGGDTPVNTLMTPDGESVTLVSTGYGVLSDINGNSSWISIDGAAREHVTSKNEVLAGYKLFELPLTEGEIAGIGLHSVSVGFYGSNNKAETVGYCMPLGAKGIYKTDTGAGTVFIRTAEQLLRAAALEDNAGALFEQELDIDLAGETFDGAVMGELAGTYDGGLRSISGLTIEADENVAPAGLFGTVTGEVKNLILKNTSVTNVGAAPTGAFAGQVAEGGKLTACGTAESCAVSGGAVAGGIAGENGGTLSQCRNKGSVTAGIYAGGIAGQNSGTIGDCYNTGDVYAETDLDDAYAGGIAGENTGALAYCYNTGAVEGVYSGGLAGMLTGGSLEHGFASGTQAGVNIGGIAGYFDTTAEIAPTVDTFSRYLTGDDEHAVRDYGNIGNTAEHALSTLTGQTVWADYQARSDFWAEDAGNENGGYPLLASFVPSFQSLSLWAAPPVETAPGNGETSESSSSGSDSSSSGSETSSSGSETSSSGSESSSGGGEDGGGE